MTERDLIGRLREAEAVYDSERLSALGEQRVLAAIRGEAAGPAGWRRPLVFAAVVALLAAVGLLLWSRWSAPPLPSAPARIAGFAVISGAARFGSDSGNGLRCQSPRCRLEALGTPSLTEVALERDARIRRRGADIELLAGRARYTVSKRPSNLPPLRIHVSHGRIEVLGTRFALEQREDGGNVRLEHGSIRFVDRDDPRRVVLLRPGDELRWPLPPVPAAQPDAGTNAEDATPPQRAKRRRRVRDAGPRGVMGDAGAALLLRIEQLRGRGRYTEAAALLERELPQVARRAARERLSYELGAILSHQLRDTTRACRHWRGHLRRFGGRRYGTQIAAARRRLACPARKIREGTHRR